MEKQYYYNKTRGVVSKAKFIRLCQLSRTPGGAGLQASPVSSAINNRVVEEYRSEREKLLHVSLYNLYIKASGRWVAKVST